MSSLNIIFPPSAEVKHPIDPTGQVETRLELLYSTSMEGLSMDNKETILSHALAGQYMGNECIYFDCGSGSEKSIQPDLLLYLKRYIDIPIIVGGGINSYKEAVKLSENGASYVVVGNALENNIFSRG